MSVAQKHTPLNTQCVRTLTPTEWGRLQGFIGYAYVNENGEDEFAFPDGISDVQKYKQFGNTVTIPLVETMAIFMSDCLVAMGDEHP
jgi:DNA (cytosine-5)-methyltransferase 1